MSERGRKRKKASESEAAEPRPRTGLMRNVKLKKTTDTAGPSLSWRSGTGFQPTPAELGELWHYDNACAAKYMKNCPIRVCSDLVQGLKDLKEASGDDSEERHNILMDEKKQEINTMWQQASQHFEIYKQPKHEEKGYRMRVKLSGLPLKKNSKIDFGWIAKIPDEFLQEAKQDSKGKTVQELVSWAHVFNRSCSQGLTTETAATQNYLGGPVSYLNMCTTRQMKVQLQPGRAFTVCRFQITKDVKGGSELLWDYGLKDNEEYPEASKWNKDTCCRETKITPETDKKRQENKLQRYQWYRERCLLCGHAYSNGNINNKAQRKHHLVGSHADFLGSDWDGCGSFPYEDMVVDAAMVLKKADELNILISSMNSRGWQCVPATLAFSPTELTQNDEKTLLEEFATKREHAGECGLIYLRGTHLPSKKEHFLPVKKSTWSQVTWKDNDKPESGIYGIPEAAKKTNHLNVLKIIPEILPEEYQERKPM